MASTNNSQSKNFTRLPSGTQLKQRTVSIEIERAYLWENRIWKERNRQLFKSSLCLIKDQYLFLVRVRADVLMKKNELMEYRMQLKVTTSCYRQNQQTIKIYRPFVLTHLNKNYSTRYHETWSLGTEKSQLWH